MIKVCNISLLSDTQNLEGVQINNYLSPQSKAKACASFSSDHGGFESILLLQQLIYYLINRDTIFANSPVRRT